MAAFPWPDALHVLAVLLPLLVVGGAAKAVVDRLSQFPDNNLFMDWGPWWDNRVSWKRKYRDYDKGDLRARFPWSKTLLVPLTDFWHLADFVYLTCFQTAIVVFLPMPWWAKVAAVVSMKAVLGGIFELLYRRVLARRISNPQ